MKQRIFIIACVALIMCGVSIPSTRGHVETASISSYPVAGAVMFKSITR